MLKYLFVMLAPGFLGPPHSIVHAAFYHTVLSWYFPDWEEMAQWLPDKIAYASSPDLILNVLYGNQKLPPYYDKIINQYIKHVKFVPLELEEYYKNSVLILNKQNKKIINGLTSNSIDNISVRLEKNELTNLYDYIEVLINKCKRINLYLLGISDYDESDLKEYSKQLDKIAKLITHEYKNEHSVELSFISDRILLDKMKNCNAGIDHITFAPNGKFYICPGFYHSNENASAGDLKEGIHIRNSELLHIDASPICSTCDAYHCKRCVWLNKKITNDLHIPSSQQCNISHLERNISREVHVNLMDHLPFKDITPIPEMDYLDPFLITIENLQKGKSLKKIDPWKSKNTGFANNLSKKKENILTDSSLKESLIQVIKMQKEIIATSKKLEKLNEYEPAMKLKEKHIINCRCVENRKKLLKYMPYNAKCAEVGCFKGDYAAEIIKQTNPNELHLIEINKQYIEEMNDRFASEINQKRVILHWGKSTLVLKKLPDKYFDWVYIDAKHDYHSVKDDLEICKVKVKENGLIALHDYIFFDHTKMNKYGVVEAVNEFCNYHNYQIVFFVFHNQMYNTVVLKKI